MFKKYILLVFVFQIINISSIFSAQIIQQQGNVASRIGQGFGQGLNQYFEQQRELEYQQQLMEYQYRISQEMLINQHNQLVAEVEVKQKSELNNSKLLSKLLKGYDVSNHQDYVINIWCSELPLDVKQKTIDILENNFNKK